MNYQEGKDACESDSLPVNYLVNYGLLFGSGATEVDACRFDAFMPHKVSEKSEVVEAVKEILGKAMTE